MNGLPADSYRNVLNAIEILGSDLAYATFPQRVVDAISTVVDVDLIAYNEVDPATGSGRFLLRPDVGEMPPDSAVYAAHARRFGNHPIVAQRVSRTASPNLTSFVNRLRLLGMVGNCCGQAELRLNLGMTLASSGSHLVGVSLSRSVRDFDDRDGACIEMLRPHIVTAYKNARRFADADQIRIAPGQLTADPPLTRRESEVLYWVSMGKTNEEVGIILGAKSPTIKKHLERIYDKLGVPNRTAAARVSQAAWRPAP